MKFKLFNAQQCTTALRNANNFKKNKKIQFKLKKSDLNQKKSDFFDFLLKIMIFFQPWSIISFS